MANNSRLRWVKWLVVLVVLGGGIGGGYWYLTSGHAVAAQYQTAPAGRGDLTQAVTATGQLNPVVNVQVGSQISGIIQKLYADFNSTVKSNQVIAQLDPATYRAAVHQAEGDLANAKAGLELAQINAKRSAELLTSHLVSPSDNDKAVADLHQAEAMIKIKEAALEKAKVDLERCTITAPVDGVVISRNVDVGQTVAASLQAPTLFIIANDLTKMQIDANVAEADVGEVEVGKDVDFTVDAFPYRTFHGKVMQVRNAPITVQNVVTYDTVIEVSNPELKLKPGMTANVSIIIARRENALKIPNAALRFRLPETVAAEAKTNTPALVAAEAPRPAGGSSGGGPEVRRSGGGGGGNWRGGPGGRPRADRQVARTVYVLSGSGPGAKPKPAQIKTGISDGAMTEVVEGLNPGDAVVTAVLSGEGAAGFTSRPPNPFGGGFRRF